MSTASLEIFIPLFIAASLSANNITSSNSLDCSPAVFAAIQAGSEEDGGSVTQILSSTSAPVMYLASIHTGPICAGFMIEFIGSENEFQSGIIPAKQYRN